MGMTTMNNKTRDAVNPKKTNLLKMKAVLFNGKVQQARNKTNSNGRYWKLITSHQLVVVILLLISLQHPNVASSEAFSTTTTTNTPSLSLSSNSFLPKSQVSSMVTLGVTKSDNNDNSDDVDSSTIERLRGGDDKDPSTSKKLFSRPIYKELLAEMIGTYIIVQIGTGSVMSAIFTDSLVGLFQIASVWIIAVTMAICTTASISGAHLNPAVSIAFALVRPSSFFNWKKVVPYSIAQLFGAIAGSWTNLVLYSSSIAAYEKANGIVRASASGIASAKAFGEYFVAPVLTSTAFFAEAIGTAILSFVIFSLTNPKNDIMKDKFVPPLIGITVGALIAVLAPLTQAGFNPARDFGPRIVAFLAGWKTVAFQGCWIYIVAPIVGALAGALLADKVLYPSDS